MELSDHELLARFASRREQTAFSVLVERHLPAVWAVAQSRTGDAEAARDLAQEAFALLARQAGRFRAEAVVSGWLFLTVRNLASKWLRSNARRRQREIVYATDPAMESSPISSDPSLLKRILVPALDELPAGERDMLLSRYFENRTCREIATVVGSTEEAVRKRTGRALEKLRLILARRGFASSAAALGTAITTFAATAPPAGLAHTITAASIAAAASGTAVLGGFSVILALTKTAKALAAAAVLAAAGAAAWLVFKPLAESATAAAGRNRAASVASSGDADAARPRPVLGMPGKPGGGALLTINREGLEPGSLAGAERMVEMMFQTADGMEKYLPDSEIQKITATDAKESMKPLSGFVSLDEKTTQKMERILTEHGIRQIRHVFWNDPKMMELVRANRGPFTEAITLRLMNGKPEFGNTNPELDRRAASWAPGVKEACLNYMEIYKGGKRGSMNVMEGRDWTENEATLATMRAEVPPDQIKTFDGFVSERKTIVREGRALSRSQELAEELQLNPTQRQAVFEEFLQSGKEDEIKVKALLNETQRSLYHKK